MGYSAFLFDMDGTLVDNMRVHYQIWSEFLALHGVNITPAEFSHLGAGRTNPEILRLLLSPDLTDEQISALSAEKERLYRQRFLPLMKPVDGLRAFLQAARGAGIRTAVASSAGHENIQFHLTGLDLQGCFDALIGAEDVANGKPAPDLFLAAAQCLELDPAACLVFEDTPTGLEAARRAGMRAVAITTTYPAEALAQNPSVLRAAPDFSGLSPLEFLS